MPERIETTYADLRPTDLVIDKAGNAWPIADVDYNFKMLLTTFWLCDPVTKVRMHSMSKGARDSVTVSRVPSDAELDVVIAEQMLAAGNEAEELVKSALNAEVVVEYTAEEYYAAEEANEDAPLRPPPFADMTPLEQRSHLYLLHGVIAYDLKSAEELKVMHAQAHAQHEAGTLQSAYIPHTHDGSF